jgi:NADPH:quinone reductase-like Zn-dependent oxidoreductase
MKGDKTMKAIVFNKRSDQPLTLSEWPTPVATKNQLLVKVVASSINAGDLARIDFGMIKKRFPLTGSEFAGVVVETGPSVARFNIGDPVYGYLNQGAHAEFACIAENDLVCKIPETIKFEQAATIPYGALSALYFLNRSGKTPEQLTSCSILINGASGNVGQFAVQMAKALGMQVTGVASGEKQDLLKRLGCDATVDYQHTDVYSLAEKFDIIFDVKGNLDFRKSHSILTENGRLITTAIGPVTLTQMLVSQFFSKRTLKTGIAKYRPSDLQQVTKLVSSGTLITAGQSYPLEEISNLLHDLRIRTKQEPEQKQEARLTQTS